MRSLAVRSREEEQMDSLALDEATYARVLRDLSRVNRLTMTARPLLDFLRRGTTAMPSFRLLDVGFGQGDLLRALARWSSKRGIAADLVGVDLNPRSEISAQAATPTDMPIRYTTGDYQDVSGEFDFIVSSQVAHHMNDDQLDAFLRFMEAKARRGWMIGDLHRHGFAYRAYPLLARLMGVHRIVREDGQLSIARSMRPGEWPPVLARAGIDPADVRITRWFPFRLCLQRLR
jgi:2-polyprenyl-3-methyl-5-hydroxy-6-metoxy-1,4-benzoquinol methylase